LGVEIIFSVSIQWLQRRKVFIGFFFDNFMNNIMNAFRRLGYNSQTKVAEAIHGTGILPHSSAESVRAYFNQVLNGKRPLSVNLRQAIVSISNGDETIAEQIISQDRKARDIDQSLYDVLRAYVDKLGQKFPELDRSGKLEYLSCLEGLCKK